MNLSISDAESVGLDVITCIWLFVISGTASIGNFKAEYIPNKISIRIKNPITIFCLIEKAIILSIIN
jgi:hypothetical protein